MSKFKHPKLVLPAPVVTGKIAAIDVTSPAGRRTVVPHQMCAEEARLWASYCDTRDAVVKIHEDCKANNARSPRMVFVFCATKCRFRTYRAPDYHWKSRRIKFLKQALDFAQYVLDNPGGKSNQDTGPVGA